MVAADQAPVEAMAFGFPADQVFVGGQTLFHGVVEADDVHVVEILNPRIILPVDFIEGAVRFDSLPEGIDFLQQGGIALAHRPGQGFFIGNRKADGHGRVVAAIQFGDVRVGHGEGDFLIGHLGG